MTVNIILHSTLDCTEETITSWNIQVSASLLYIVVTMCLVAICLAHLLFLLGMKGRWSAANVPQLCSTIHLSPLSLHTVIKSNLAAKYTSSYICMTRQNRLH